VPADDVIAFVRANLPAGARVLEVGAGDGELARVLRRAGHDVVAVDPEGGEGVLRVPLAELDAPERSFDAAVAVVSLHHLEPLEESCRRLAAALRPGAVLVVDELDFATFDERAAVWWLARRRELGFPAEHDPAMLVSERRSHLHSLDRVEAALEPFFELGRPLRGPYLYRWGLAPGLRGEEERLIAEGRLPAVGARLAGIRRAR
jgi:SAM-dependent methyltransferase